MTVKADPSKRQHQPNRVLLFTSPILSPSPRLSRSLVSVKDTMGGFCSKEDAAVMEKSADKVRSSCVGNGDTLHSLSWLRSAASPLVPFCIGPRCRRSVIAEFSRRPVMPLLCACRPRIPEGEMTRLALASIHIPSLALRFCTVQGWGTQKTDHGRGLRQWQVLFRTLPIGQTGECSCCMLYCRLMTRHVTCTCR